MYLKILNEADSIENTVKNLEGSFKQVTISAQKEQKDSGNNSIVAKIKSNVNEYKRALKTLSIFAANDVPKEIKEPAVRFLNIVNKTIQIASK